MYDDIKLTDTELVDHYGFSLKGLKKSLDNVKIIHEKIEMYEDEISNRSMFEVPWLPHSDRSFALKCCFYDKYEMLNFTAWDQYKRDLKASWDTEIKYSNLIVSPGSSSFIYTLFLLAGIISIALSPLGNSIKAGFVGTAEWYLIISTIAAIIDLFVYIIHPNKCKIIFYKKMLKDEKHDYEVLLDSLKEVSQKDPAVNRYLNEIDNGIKLNFQNESNDITYNEFVEKTTENRTNQLFDIIENSRATVYDMIEDSRLKKLYLNMLTASIDLLNACKLKVGSMTTISNMFVIYLPEINDIIKTNKQVNLEDTESLVELITNFTNIAKRKTHEIKEDNKDSLEKSVKRLNSILIDEYEKR